MKLLAAALVAAAVVLGGADASASQESSNHQFETPKGTVVVTVVHGPPASAPLYRSAVAESSASEESSSVASEESSLAAEESSGAKVGTDDLSHYVLPPEPAAAKGYRSLGCQETDSCGNQLETPPCLENCDAEVANSNVAGGQVVYSQPLGDLSAGGFVPAAGTRTDASNPSWTIVPQTGIGSSSSLSTNTAMPPHVADVLAKVTEPLPGNAYVSPQDRRLQRLEVLEAAERARREAEKAQLTSSMKQHQGNLLKIEQMARALRWQYMELRRQHNLLRTHIAANKATYEELGGDDEYKGTDLDIEAKIAPNTYETLDDIAPVNPRVNKEGTDRILNDMTASHVAQAGVLKNLHKTEQQGVDAFFGKKAAAAESDAAKALADAKALTGQ